MMIALVMMKISLMSMSTFVECMFENTPNREDRYCKRHKHVETKLLQERLDDCAERFNIFRAPCELCNERGHLNLQ